MLEFSRTIYEDLSNYDTAGAWPTLIDDYVTHVRRRHASVDIDASDLSPASLARAGLIPLSIPASPGSKRQLPMDDEDAEADRLARQLSELRSGSGEVTLGPTTAACSPRRGYFTAKRTRVGHAPLGQEPGLGPPFSPGPRLQIVYSVHVDVGHPLTHVLKVKALSEGSSACVSMQRAHTYTQHRALGEWMQPAVQGPWQ